MIPDRLISALEEAGVSTEKNIPLREYSTFRIGGQGELGIFPATADELTASVLLCRGSGVTYRIIGKGSNLLFSDGLTEGAFIFTEKMASITVDGDTLTADAGASLAALSSRAAENSLTGLEFAKGIPGSVGGAVYMNAGAYGGEISQVLISSIAFDTHTGETLILSASDHYFSYRHSVYMERPIICLSATFKLSKGVKTEIEEKMKDYAIARREKQPLEFPSAGSYFKRPDGYFAGKLIEDCGLKGLRVGGAAVSEKHAGFVINLGNATAEDVLALEEIIRNTVKEKYGVTLEREVRKVE